MFSGIMGNIFYSLLFLFVDIRILSLSTVTNDIFICCSVSFFFLTNVFR